MSALALLRAGQHGHGDGGDAIELVMGHAVARLQRHAFQHCVQRRRQGFYIRCGFSRTRETFDGEDVLELPLRAGDGRPPVPDGYKRTPEMSRAS